jgi:hypothetical protein
MEKSIARGLETPSMSPFFTRVAGKMAMVKFADQS